MNESERMDEKTSQKGEFECDSLCDVIRSLVLGKGSKPVLETIVRSRSHGANEFVLLHESLEPCLVAAVRNVELLGCLFDDL